MSFANPLCARISPSSPSTLILVRLQVQFMNTDLLTNEARTLTKAELAEMLFDRVGLNKREAKDIVDTFFEEIRDALARGEPVKLSGFGNFQVRNKPPRPGRNPKTGETIPIAARRVVTFHASQKLKSAVEAEPVIR